MWYVAALAEREGAVLALGTGGGVAQLAWAMGLTGSKCHQDAQHGESPRNPGHEQKRDAGRPGGVGCWRVVGGSNGWRGSAAGVYKWERWNSKHQPLRLQAPFGQVATARDWQVPELARGAPTIKQQLKRATHALRLCTAAHPTFAQACRFKGHRKRQRKKKKRR